MSPDSLEKGKKRQEKRGKRDIVCCQMLFIKQKVLHCRKVRQLREESLVNKLFKDDIIFYILLNTEYIQPI